MAVSQRTGVDTVILRLGIYDQNKNISRVLSSEQVTSLPRLF